MTIRCSIVIPVYDRAGLTRRCLDAILAQPPEAGFEVIVVDDASTDSTAALLAGYGEPIRSVRLDSNSGFAAACNAGAKAAQGEYLVFLNNDTVPRTGWLDALVRYADSHPAAAVVGSKLLFPDDTIQHAGVAICQDGYPRHIYAGLPAGHPAVGRSRRFQAVTAACALVRRDAFEEVDGFDESFRNSFEDADLCLRLGERGHEVHYCHESVLHHLESVSRSRRSKETEQSARLFLDRWRGRARPDDLDYYVADGLLELRYRDLYPIGLEVAGELASVSEGGRRAEAERLIEQQARHVADLLRETVRLTAHVAELETGLSTRGRSARPTRREAGASEPPQAEELLRRVEELEIEIHELQSGIAEALSPADSERRPAGSDANGAPPFEPGKGLGYRKLVREIRDAVEASVPADSTVLVISRGDEHLLEFGGRAAWHFPQDERGTYSGHHPPDSRAAIEQLEELRRQGAEYLLVPVTADWWLEHYVEFATHLGDHYAELTGLHESCRLFSLRELERREKLGSGSRALTAEELREEVIRLGPWHLEVEITPEVSTRASLEIPPDTPGGTFYRMSFHSPRAGFMRRMRRIFPNGLEGRSVMDCACNCGAYLLWCKELGAGECYGFDAREHWIRQARFLAEHRDQTDGVRFEVHDLYDLDRVDPGHFDVTLFNGIFYHLPDPVYGMKLAADRTDQLLVVNTATRLGAPDGTLVAAKEAPDRAMSGVHGLNWFPAGPRVMARILDWMGFPEVRCSHWRIPPRQDTRNGRLEMVAARENGFFAAYDGALPDERARVRELVSTTASPGTTVAVVTPSGWEPLDFDGREGVELARVEDGERTTDADVLARLEALLEAGPRYVAIPDAAARWLEGRPELARHLRRFYVLSDQGSGCLLVSLDESPLPGPPAAQAASAATAEPEDEQSRG